MMEETKGEKIDLPPIHKEPQNYGSSSRPLAGLNHSHKNNFNNKRKVAKNSNEYRRHKSSDSNKKDEQWFHHDDQEGIEAEESDLREDQSI